MTNNEYERERERERERLLDKEKKAICKEKVYKHNKFDDKALRGWQLNKRERERERELYAKRKFINTINLTITDIIDC